MHCFNLLKALSSSGCFPERFSQQISCRIAATPRTSRFIAVIVVCAVRMSLAPLYPCSIPSRIYRRHRCTHCFRGTVHVLCFPDDFLTTARPPDLSNPRGPSIVIASVDYSPGSFAKRVMVKILLNRSYPNSQHTPQITLQTSSSFSAEHRTSLPCRLPCLSTSHQQVLGSAP